MRLTVPLAVEAPDVPVIGRDAVPVIVMFSVPDVDDAVLASPRYCADTA